MVGVISLASSLETLKKQLSLSRSVASKNVLLLTILSGIFRTLSDSTDFADSTRTFYRDPFFHFSRKGTHRFRGFYIVWDHVPYFWPLKL